MSAAASCRGDRGGKNRRKSHAPVALSGEREASSSADARLTTSAFRPSNPPFTAIDKSSGEHQQWFVWSYVAPSLARQQADKVALVVHGAFVSADEAQAFAKQLHDKWDQFDISITQMGAWVPCPLPTNLSRQVPSTYDDERLHKIMEQHRRQEEAVRQKNQKRMKEVRRLQKKQAAISLARSKLNGDSAVEMRKPLTESDITKIENHYNPNRDKTLAHPLEGLVLKETKNHPTEFSKAKTED